MQWQWQWETVPTQQVVMARGKLKQWQWHCSRPGSAASDVPRKLYLEKQPAETVAISKHK